MINIMEIPIENNSDKKTYGFVVIGFYLCMLGGIFSYLTTIPGIICGHIAYRKIKSEPEQYTIAHKRIVITGLLVGYSVSIIWIFVFKMIYEIFFS